MTEFNTGLPSIRQIQTFIKNKTQLEISLSNTETTIKGTIQWQDQNTLCIVNDRKEKMLIWFQALVYIKQLS